MKMLEIMLPYFEGEKIEALVFILPLGLASLIFGAWLLTDNATPFTRGVMIPFLIMGIVATLTGATVGLRTPAQVAQLEQALTQDPAAAIKAERARMEKVNQAWPLYLIAWAAFGIGGLTLRFAIQGDFAQGLGIALVFFAGLGLMIDGFAERRARPYAEALNAWQAGVGE